jgi:ABC-2 type transport system permease protein
MFNMLRMDFHRFRRNKPMLVLLALFFVLHLFGIFMMREYQESLDIGSMDGTQFFQSTLSQAPSWVLLYLTVFTVHFYSSEYNSGFYKNYMSMPNARRNSVFSKIIILGLFTCLMMAVVIVSGFVGRIVFFNTASVGDPGDFMKALLGQLLLHWAFAVVILCIATLTRNLVASLVTGFVVALNSAGMLLGAVETLADGVHLSQYLLVNTIVTLKDYSSSSEFLHSVLVAVVFMAVFTFVTVRFKMREDLR